MGNQSFSVALTHLKANGRAARAGWNGKGMWICLIGPEDYLLEKEIGRARQLPWIGMKTADGHFVPWLASQTDLLANDWVLLPE